MTAWTILIWLDPKNPTYEDFGRAVSVARKQGRNWTQAQLARRMSVSPSYISMIENGGGGEITVSRFIQLRRLLGPTLAPFAVLFMEPRKRKNHDPN